MKSIEWVGHWALIEWQDVGFLVRKGTIVASLKSKSRIDAECEAMLLGLLK